MQLKDKIEKIREYCRANQIFYLKLDIELPHGIDREAQHLFESGYFTAHRETHGKGWSSAVLRGEEWYVTTYKKGAELKWTMLIDHAPIMTKWLKETFPNNGNYGRCRFMLLEPGGYINSHTDTHEWKEGQPLKDDIFSAINICITQPDDCYLRRTSDMEEVPFEPRSVFCFNNGPFHEAANFSKENRYHFIVHGGMNNARAELFVRSFEKEYPNAIL